MARGCVLSIEQAVDEALAGAPFAQWGVCVRRDGTVVAQAAPDAVLPSASMGKVLVLMAVAREIVEGRLRADDPIVAGDHVADSGAWQHFRALPLTVEAACVLTAMVSDNLAANALLTHLGLDRVQRLSSELGIPETRVLDRIRDLRGDGHPHAPSVARAGDLAALMERLALGTALEPADGHVSSWLELNTDLSMVASAFHLDPLAHRGAGQGVDRLFNKTGTDSGVRADAGSLRSASGTWSYAVLARWEDDTRDRTDAVMNGMQRIGQAVRASAG